MAGRGRSNADELLVAALASGKAVKDAAGEAGVSERTAFRRLEQADFCRRVAELRGRMVESAAGRLAAAAGAACETLTKLLSASSESVQLAAAKTILDQAVRLREVTDLERRLAALEEACSRRDASSPSKGSSPLMTPAVRQTLGLQA